MLPFPPILAGTKSQIFFHRLSTWGFLIFFLYSPQGSEAAGMRDNATYPQYFILCLYSFSSDFSASRPVCTFGALLAQSVIIRWQTAPQWRPLSHLLSCHVILSLSRTMCNKRAMAPLDLLQQCQRTTGLLRFVSRKCANHMCAGGPGRRQGHS